MKRDGALITATIILLAAAGIVIWSQGRLQEAVASITVISPSNSDSWSTGSTHRIQWITKDIPANYKISVSLRRIPPPPLQTEGQEFDPIVFTNLPNTGSVDWTLADMYPSGTYVLSVTSYESVPVTNPVTAESKPFLITNEPQLIGGQKDAHGCLIAAGYSWCEVLAECIRPWEIKCVAPTH